MRNVGLYELISCRSFDTDISYLVEFAVITLDAATKKPKAKIYRPEEVNVLLDKQGVMKKEDDEEMKA